MFKINQLIVIGAPSCAGKSFLINKMKQNTIPHLTKQLNMGKPSTWRYIHASPSELRNIRYLIIEKLVVHYDLYRRDLDNDEFNSLHELINHSNHVQVLTLHTPAKVLVHRNNLRIIKYLLKPSFYTRNIGHINWLLNKRKAYNHNFSNLLYSKWFCFLNRNSLVIHNHLWIDHNHY